MVSREPSLGVMVEGKEGLRGWKESVYLFLSQDHDTALRRALEIGRSHSGRASRRTKVGRNQADIVTLDNLGSNPIEFEVNLGTKKPVLGTKKPRSEEHTSELQSPL